MHFTRWAAVWLGKRRARRLDRGGPRTFYARDFGCRAGAKSSAVCGKCRCGGGSFASAHACVGLPSTKVCACGPRQSAQLLHRRRMLLSLLAPIDSRVFLCNLRHTIRRRRRRRRSQRTGGSNGKPRCHAPLVVVANNTPRLEPLQPHTSYRRVLHWAVG